MKRSASKGEQPETSNIFQRLSPRARVREWMFARLPRSDQLTLTQGNVYILPSRAGWAMLATLIVLLIAAINYQLNLGYLLTFLLAGSAAASMVVGHGNLRGLQLSLTHSGTQGGCFAHAPCPMHISLHNARRSRRWGIGLALHKTRHNTDHSDAWTWVDIPEQGSTSVQLSFMPTRRGRQELPAISILTRYPLGAFRVWALWRPQTLVWVYPAPETHAPPLPAASPETGLELGDAGLARANPHLGSVRAGIFQFPDVTRPVILHQQLHGFSGNSVHVKLQRPVHLAQQRLALVRFHSPRHGGMQH